MSAGMILRFPCFAAHRWAPDVVLGSSQTDAAMSALSTQLQNVGGRSVRRTRKHEPEEQGQPSVELSIDPEEFELEQFLDSLGGQGIANVKLYRILPTGKHQFVDEGPPVKFSEKTVQVDHGAGDYLIRSQLNGRWYRSKTFSVAPILSIEGQKGGGISSTSEIDLLKARIEADRGEMERLRAQMEADRQASAQRSHELTLRLLETRTPSAAGPSLTELITAVESLRHTSNGAPNLAGLKELFEMANQINLLRSDSKEEDSSWLGILKSVAPELAQTVMQIVTARSAPPLAAPIPGNVPIPQAKPFVEVDADSNPAVMSLPTAYDQIGGQLRGLLERLDAQIKMGLDPSLAVDTLVELEAANDPIAHLLLNAVGKSSNSEQWLTWLRSQVGTSVQIEQQTVTFLSKVFEIVKALPEASEDAIS
jgi:hypothetical protein